MLYQPSPSHISEILRFRRSGVEWLVWHSVRPHLNRNNSGTAGSTEMSEAALESGRVPLPNVGVPILSAA